MDRSDSFVYRAKVENLFKEMRKHCMGQNIPLTSILPEEPELSTNEEKATFLGKQILFQVADFHPNADEDDLELCWQWLYATILYLLNVCTEEDHTFGNLIRLIGMSQTTREHLLANYASICSDICDSPTTPYPLEDLDTAVLALLDAHGELDNAKLGLRGIQLWHERYFAPLSRTK